MTVDILLAVMNDTIMGQVERRRGGRLSFRYSAEWLARSPFPLSHSMKLSDQEYPHRLIANYLWGLLPDSEQVIRTWAQRFQVGPTNVFGLIANVGTDVAGAVGFVRPEALDAYLADERLEPLTEADIASRIRELRQDAAMARRAQDVGKISLAGAQAKTAFQKTPEGWALPAGRAPTTHIFKVPRPELGGHVENEHFCLRLARRVGLPAVESQVCAFEDEIAIVIARYDRVERDGRILRRHQEDLCQALGKHPTEKYENDGGPSVPDIMQVLNGSRRPETDRTRFMASITYNFLIGGTDAHAKNYALVMGLNSTLQLAPLYDLTSIFPYVDRYNDVRMAMKIDRHYKCAKIFPRHFANMARRCVFPAERMLDTLRDQARQLPDLAVDTAREVRAEGVDHPVIDSLVDGISRQCEAVLRRVELERVG